MSFDTLVNFRDLGDYQTADGRQIKAKKLLRSGEPVKLSQHDITLLTDTYHLENIIDFRGENETTEKPDDTIPGAVYLNLDLFRGDDNEATSFEELQKLKPEQSADDKMMAAYAHLITSPIAQADFKIFFETLLTANEGASLWHCFAGKDRTGLASALVLYILGADRETIYHDYLRTNEGRKAANEAILAEVRAQGATDEQVADVLVMLNVKEAYLAYAEQIINKDYQGLEHYLTHTLKITNDEREAFKTKYLEA